LPKGTLPEAAVTQFLDVFGATMDQGVVFEDASGTPIVISKALFQNGKGEFKWQTNRGGDKMNRLEDVHLLAMTVADPDEIWWFWQKDDKISGNWRLKRRYLKSFEVGDTKEYVMSIFEWGDSGWTGSTVYPFDPKNDAAKRRAYDRKRIGLLVYPKK
jgi:hypothetical protein